MSSVPKRIHTLWLQGEEAAPPLVQAAFRRWRALHPAYEFNILCRADVERRLAHTRIRIAHLTAQALSDVVRAHLLLEDGGIWVDATLYPVVALDTWLDKVVTEAGFFAFAQPGPDRPLSSWFLVATPNNPILVAWWREIERFWAAPRQLAEGIPANPAASVSRLAEAKGTYPYYWFHYLFQYLLETEPQVALRWARCVRYSADAPHALQALLTAKADPTPRELATALYAAPVQKLNWRMACPIDLIEQFANLAAPVQRAEAVV